MDEHGIVFQRLNKVRPECVLQQGRHRTVGLEITGKDGRFVVAVATD